MHLQFEFLSTHQRTLDLHSFGFPASFEGTFSRTTLYFVGLKQWFHKGNTHFKHPLILGNLWTLSIKSLAAWGLEVLDELVHPYIRGLVRGPGCQMILDCWTLPPPPLFSGTKMFDRLISTSCNRSCLQTGPQSRQRATWHTIPLQAMVFWLACELLCVLSETTCWCCALLWGIITGSLSGSQLHI